MVERWTQERRRQHTREVLLDAAERVFGSRGFDGASLEEIADAAGYTRGAIYKHFGNKAELFLAVNERFNERFLAGFVDLLEAPMPPQELDLALIAKRWHDLQNPDISAYALGTEFSLYVLRNPEVRERAAKSRRAVAEMIARFMDEWVARAGATLRIPAMTLARIALAAGDGLALSGYLDGSEDDLYLPFLELFMSAWEAPTATSTQPRRKQVRRPTKRGP
jgi:AcrR family transcriptional regulator